MEEEISRIVGELEAIAGSLNDVSMALLSDAIARRSGERPALEKKVSQARRAVEKAINHLSISRDEDD